jgi:hypothetical protein
MTVMPGSWPRTRRRVNGSIYYRGVIRPPQGLDWIARPFWALDNDRMSKWVSDGGKEAVLKTDVAESGVVGETPREVIVRFP